VPAPGARIEALLDQDDEVIESTTETPTRETLSEGQGG
jgi:hypothetical protein